MRASSRLGSRAELEEAMAITHLLLSLIARCWPSSLNIITRMIKARWEDMQEAVPDSSWQRRSNLGSLIDHHQDNNNSLSAIKMSFRESSQLWLSRPLKSHTRHSCHPSKTRGPFKPQELLLLSSFKSNSEWLKSKQRLQQWRELLLREAGAQNAL